MPTTALQPTASVNPPKTSVNGAPAKRISWEAFQRKYLSREDGYKYEWVGGRAEKTKLTMDKTQLYLLVNLLRHFALLKKEGKVAGELISEPDLFFLVNHRRPDIAWLTDEQTYSLADPEAYEVPAFVIEVISTNDQINAVKEKMNNYRDAGVQVVWQIFPKLKQVEVYFGDRLDQSKVCEGDDVCSAAPALPALALQVNDIFYHPGKKA